MAILAHPSETKRGSRRRAGRSNWTCAPTARMSSHRARRTASGVPYEKLGDWTTPIDSLPVFDPALDRATDARTTPDAQRHRRLIQAPSRCGRRPTLRAMGPAIEENGGDAPTFKAAGVPVNDFALDDRTALALLSDWNAGCVPPWNLGRES